MTPTFDNLTIGGLVVGSGLESSSHRFGLFQNICESYELVLSDGSLVKCARDNDPDLFYSIPWSFGTLGFLTLVELRIIPCTRYVKLNYYGYKDLNSLLTRLEKESQNVENDYVEAILFRHNEGVVITGQMATPNDDDDKKRINKIDRWYKPWFYSHVEKIIQENNSYYEYIPFKHYHNRHSKSIFWEMESFTPFANNKIFRYTFGWILPAIILLLRIAQEHYLRTIKRIYSDKHICKDFIIPLSYADTFIQAINYSLQVEPLWICPVKISNNAGMIQSKNNDEMFVNIGVYGKPKVKDYSFWTHMRERMDLDKLSVKLKGYQLLHSDLFLDRVEFGKMFDHTLYNHMRWKLDCETAFPDVYDKIRSIDESEGLL